MFKSEHIKDVFKSKVKGTKQNIPLITNYNILYQLPGEKFAAGEHIIRYVATDLDDQSSKCEFTISVKRNRLTASNEFSTNQLYIL